MARYRNGIALNSEDGRIYAVRTKRGADMYGFIDIVVESEEATEQALNVVAKYMQNNGLRQVQTDFGCLRLDRLE